MTGRITPASGRVGGTIEKTSAIARGLFLGLVCAATVGGCDPGRILLPVSGGPLRGQHVQPNDLGFSRVALHSFHFGFLESDHHLKRVGIVKDGDLIRANFADRGDDNPWEFSARYTALGLPLTGTAPGMPSAGPLRELTGSCDGRCVIPVEGFTFRRFTHFALVGFEFIADGFDRHIRAIEIMPTFVDPRADGCRTNCLIIRFGDSGGGRFLYRIQYHVILNTSPVFPGETPLVQDTVERSPPGGGLPFLSTLSGPPEDRVISGFSLQFAKGDRHVRNFSVDLSARLMVLEDDTPDIDRDRLVWKIRHLLLSPLR